MQSIQTLHAPRRRLLSCARFQSLLATTHPSRINSFPASTFIPNFHASPYSTTVSRPAKKGKGSQHARDMRVVLIRYHLKHPRNPRPLRFSRLRALRHWTIHRAWQLYKRQQQRAHELQLEREYQSMRTACEALRLVGEDGLTIGEPTAFLRKANGEGGPEWMARTAREAAAADKQKEVGKLYRVAMLKHGIWEGAPIEYGRAQTETPSKEGWNHDWTRK